MVKKFIQPKSNINYIFVDDKYSHVVAMNNMFPHMYCIWLNKNEDDLELCECKCM